MGRTCPCGVPELDIILKSLTEQRLYSFHQKQESLELGSWSTDVFVPQNPC